MSTNTGFSEPPRRGSNGTYSLSSNSNYVEIIYKNGEKELIDLKHVLKYIMTSPINGQFSDENKQELLKDKKVINYGLGANMIYLAMLFNQRKPIVIAERRDDSYKINRIIMIDDIEKISGKGLEDYL